ncbi:hypothetical protein [Subtercola boreus]|uniref:Uncharacterized protein n=1 Tax=Subtercola boreus TaxID=120213 RepID=A0A3E0WEF7_9MICO|nr:hypothetical protein [Subtercola boreus]RFA23620.1 hypothetical protein B7R24_01735 [Subtercola boreus]RFA24014.1 hypothetical protein B7R23_01735 [Subtercola boreus]RFA29712.1 hypothetical protein B7R25_01730 [Subtercola boreus]
MTLFDFDSLEGGQGADGQWMPEGDAPPPRSRASVILRRIALIAVIVIIIGVPTAAVGWGFLHQRIGDQLAVWQYDPSADVAGMAADSGMNDEGRFYFYASSPTVENAADFQTVCGSSSDDFVLLGCYTGSSIHVFNVSDARLSGIRGVTAAHEMLHAVYARLSDSDRVEIDRELEAQYEAVKDDPGLAARMASYATTEPGERDNELHSIFGTELASLSPELEAHYAKYFADRSKVVALNTSFEAVFDQLHSQEDALAVQLTAAGDAIEHESATYTSDSDTLGADVADFNGRADSGGFDTQEQFDRERSALEDRQAELQTRYDSIQKDIAGYDDLRHQLEALDSQASELNRSLDSTLQAPPSAG